MNNLKKPHFVLNYLFVRLWGTGRSLIITFMAISLIVSSRSNAATSLDLETHHIPDVPKALPSNTLNPLNEKIYWQNYALKLFHGESPETNQLNEIFETNEATLAEELNHALENAKIEEWFF